MAVLLCFADPATACDTRFGLLEWLGRVLGQVGAPGAPALLCPGERAGTGAHCGFMAQGM